MKTKVIIGVVALYLMCQIIADVTATKIVDVFGITFPAGTFIYAISFTARDLAHKQLGKKDTLFLVGIGAVVNVLMALYFIMAIKLPYPAFWKGQVAYEQVLGIVPRIVIASILAELVSQVVDTVIYQYAWDRKLPQYMRVLLSNIIATPVDSALFAVVAFAGIMPVPALIGLALGQTAFKLIITVVSLPMIYIVPQGRVS